MNRKRMEQIEKRAAGFRPRYYPGQRVRRLDYDGEEGVIDAVYIDYESAFDSGVVTKDWYDAQNITPRTSKEGRFYSLIVEDGAVMAGEKRHRGRGNVVSRDGQPVTFDEIARRRTRFRERMAADKPVPWWRRVSNWCHNTTMKVRMWWHMR